MKLIWSDPGLADLEAIHNYIHNDSETYAREFAERIVTSADRLVQFPRLGRVLPEAGDENVRELIGITGSSIELQVSASRFCPSRTDAGICNPCRESPGRSIED